MVSRVKVEQFSGKIGEFEQEGNGFTEVKFQNLLRGIYCDVIMLVLVGLCVPLQDSGKRVATTIV
jgi:hypothetical protein